MANTVRDLIRFMESKAGNQSEPNELLEEEDVLKFFQLVEACAVGELPYKQVSIFLDSHLIPSLQTDEASLYVKSILKHILCPGDASQIKALHLLSVLEDPGVLEILTENFDKLSIKTPVEVLIKIHHYYLVQQKKVQEKEEQKLQQIKEVMNSLQNQLNLVLESHQKLEQIQSKVVETKMTESLENTVNDKKQKMKLKFQPMLSQPPNRNQSDNEEQQIDQKTTSLFDKLSVTLLGKSQLNSVDSKQQQKSKDKNNAKVLDDRSQHILQEIDELWDSNNEIIEFCTQVKQDFQELSSKNNGVLNKFQSRLDSLGSRFDEILKGNKFEQFQLQIKKQIQEAQQTIQTQSTTQLPAILTNQSTTQLSKIQKQKIPQSPPDLQKTRQQVTSKEKTQKLFNRPVSPVSPYEIYKMRQYTTQIQPEQKEQMAKESQNRKIPQATTPQEIKKLSETSVMKKSMEIDYQQRLAVEQSQIGKIVSDLHIQLISIKKNLHVQNSFDFDGSSKDAKQFNGMLGSYFDEQALEKIKFIETQRTSGAITKQQASIRLVVLGEKMDCLAWLIRSQKYVGSDLQNEMVKAFKEAELTAGDTERSRRYIIATSDSTAVITVCQALATFTNTKDEAKSAVLHLKVLELLVLNNQAADQAVTEGRLQQTLNQFLVLMGGTKIDPEDESFVNWLLRLMSILIRVPESQRIFVGRQSAGAVTALLNLISAYKTEELVMNGLICIGQALIQESVFLVLKNEVVGFTEKIERIKNEHRYYDQIAEETAEILKRYFEWNKAVNLSELQNGQRKYVPILDSSSELSQKLYQGEYAINEVRRADSRDGINFFRGQQRRKASVQQTSVIESMSGMKKRKQSYQVSE